MGRILLLVAGAALLLSIAAACSTDTGDLEDRIDALELEQTAGAESAQRSAMVATLAILGSAGLHDIDTTANEEKTAPTGVSGGVGRAVLALASTDWPDELKSQADGFLATLQELATALDSEDAAVIGPPAAAAHEAQHEFEHGVTNYVSRAVGLPVEEEEGEPTAASTPAAAATP